MSSNVEKLLGQVEKFEKIATDSLAKTAEKLDPKAKVRNRGNVCVPAESAKDKKDHFPINNEAQARNALARVNQFSKVPDWYSGSLQGLVSLVARKVKAKYPSIEVSKEAKKPGAAKKKSAYYDALLSKYSQQTVPTGHKLNTENVEQDWKDWEAQQGAKVRQPTSFTRDVPPVANNEGKIDWERAQPSGATSDFELPDTSPPASAPAGIPYRADVRAAQIQYNKWNKANGNYGTPIDEDGKLGPKTKAAFSGYRPGGNLEEIIKELSEAGMTWNVRTPEQPKATSIHDSLEGKPQRRGNL